MKRYACKSCGSVFYSAADIEHMTEPKEEYYNGKVVCIDNRERSEYWTVGKVYEFVNGSCKADNGNVSPLFGDKIKDFLQIEKEYRVKFIEFKG